MDTRQTVNQVAKKALEFEAADRIRLVEAILHSLNKPDSEIEESWIVESEARYDAYKRGRIKASEWEKIKKRYEH